MSSYVKRVSSALSISLSNSSVYRGEKGARRLAREFGFCLRDSSREDAKEQFDLSYNEICVKGYGLTPPLDKRDWDNEVLKAWGQSYDD